MSGDLTKETVREDGNSRPEVGRWYWVHHDDPKEMWLGCATRIGSNYVRLEGPSINHGGSRHVIRVHFDGFWEVCREDPNWKEEIQSTIDSLRAETLEILYEVRRLTSDLAIGPQRTLTTEGETKALAMLQIGISPAQYKKDLILAKTKTLPKLFEELRDKHDVMASWMKAALYPLEAEKDELEEVIGVIDSRIFNVELYAGLIEEVVQVRKGRPAKLDAPLHLMQRRAYMDEECLSNYESGGMTFKDLKAFDAWLSKKENLERILPFERCLISMQVRRKSKDEDESVQSISDFISFVRMSEVDKLTFLYIRNGQQLHRLNTEIDFGPQLFPDIDRKLADNQKLWAKTFAGGSIDGIMSDDERSQRLEELADLEKKTKKQDMYKIQHKRREMEGWFVYSPESVYYDDVKAHLETAVTKHNRIVLLLQGLLDRSMVCHPHPPWQLWTREGFASAVVLVHDDSRALLPVDKPDFEAYRARLNKTLKRGSICVGQDEAFVARETERENARRDRDWRRPRDGWRPKRYRPDDNNGPGMVAIVVARVGKACRFEWRREARTRSRWNQHIERFVLDTMTVKDGELLNIDEYQIGDYKVFLADPRTRADYMKWAPLLLVAEEVKTGHRADPRQLEKEIQEGLEGDE